MIPKTKLLICSDTHFDSKSRNEYRWEFFSWLKSQCKELNIQAVIISGDIFNEKDNHPSKLVNKFIDNLADLLEVTEQILMIKGNHDRIDDSHPYLKWINRIPKIKFFIKPELVQLNSKQLLFIPYTKDPETEWSDIKEQLSLADYIFVHQTFEGASSENGTKLSGHSQSIFDFTKAKIYSGDIHMAQTLGKVEYIGTPYPINFGDSLFLHRVILLDLENQKAKNLFYKTISKHMLRISKPEDLKEIKLKKGDQIKIEVSLEDIVDWEKYKKSIRNYCQEEGIDMQEIKFKKKDSTVSLAKQGTKLKSMTPQEIFNQYCDVMKIGEDTKAFGIEILGEATK